MRGIKTIGWGHKITKNDPAWLKKATSITEEQANALFAQDIKVYENELNSIFRSLPKNLQNSDLYPQGFVDACISILYNSGMRNFKASPLFKAIKSFRLDHKGRIDFMDLANACDKIKETCTTQKGEVVNGLVKRRAEESLMARQ